MSEQTNNLFEFVCFIVLMAALLCVVAQSDDLKEQAVRRGHAEWVVKSNGSTSWRWKEEAK